MSGSRIALDTSAAIDALAGDSRALELQESVSAFVLPAPVVGELRYGALNSKRKLENIAAVERLVARCEVLAITGETAGVYARLRLALKERGKPIPENDLWIAAVCVEHDVPLRAVDAHFDEIDELTRAWTARIPSGGEGPSCPRLLSLSRSVWRLSATRTWVRRDLASHQGRV